MKILKSIITLIMLLTVQSGLAADSTAFQLDTVMTATSPIVDSLSVNWDAEWIGGNPEASVLITDNGAELKWASGQGSFIWVPNTSGQHTLRYTTYIDGEAQEEVYTATFLSDKGSVSSMFEWIVTNNEVTITKYIGNDTVVNIPATINGMPVVMIGVNAFANCAFVTSVTIPNGVTSIGDFAFSSCYSLSQVAMPESLKSIGFYAFSLCGALPNVMIPDGVQKIGSSAFLGCESLSNVSIPDSVTSIGYEAFDGCNVQLYDTKTIPNVILVDGWVVGYDSTFSGHLVLSGVRGIGEGAFYYCSSLASIDIRDGVSIVPLQSFYNCDSLTNVTLGNCVTNIVDSAFFGCRVLSDIVLPDSVISVGEMAFMNCHSLSNVNILGNIKSIGNHAFNSCKSLPTIAIPESVTNIGEFAFSHCELLSQITIPCGVKNIGSYAFCQCQSLTNITFEGDSPEMGHNGVFLYSSNCTAYVHRDSTGWGVEIPGKWHGIDIAYIEDDGGNVSSMFEWIVTNNEVTITKYIGTNTVVEVPAEINGYPVTAIGAEAFFECASLMNVILPDGLKIIGERAFAFCGLVEVSIPEGVTDIGDWAFWTCDLLEKVSIPNSVTNIGQRAFCWCESLEEVVIPESVASIGDRAFAFCHSMTNITFLGDSPVMGEDVFGAEDEVEDMICTAYVHSESLGWGVEIPGKWNGIDIDYIDENGGYAPEEDFKWDVTVCGVEITRYIGTATQVNIPSSIDNLPVVAVGAMAFMDCRDVESVVIPDTVQEINVAAFAYCTSLKSVTIPKSVSYIDSEAFDYCSSLETFEVSDDNDYYKSENNLLLTKDGKTLVCGVNGDVEIPYGVETIGYSAFCGITNLSSVTMSDTVSVIMEDAFGDCLSLEHIELPFSVTNIEAYAFSGSGIKSFYVDLDNPVYKSDSDVLLSKDGKVVISGINRDVEIPAGVVEISEGAFCGLAEVSGVQLPDSMENIGCFAFEWCSSLVALTIPENVSSIGERAFAGCSSLTNAIFLGNAPEMGVNVFQDYNNSICGDDFLDCTAYVRRGSAGWGVDIPGVWQGIRIEYFEGFADLDDGKDEVNGYVWFYQDLAQGGGVEIIGVDPEPEGDITIPEILDGKNVVGIGEGTFAYCDNLWLVDIPSSVRNIGDEAFFSCSEMEAIFLPNMLTNIGARAFYDCGYIEHAYIPFGVRSIGEEAFAANWNLARVSVPSSVSYMGSGVFAYCDNLSEVDLAEGLSEIGDKMFYECCSLVAVEVPDGCREIGESAFACCEELLMVSIPNSVTRLGDPICEVGDIFAGCNSLSIVIFIERTNPLSVMPCGLPDSTSVVVSREGYGFVNWRDASKDVWAPVDDPFRMEEPVRVVPVWSSVNEPGADWVTSKASAEAKALAEGKRILLVAGRKYSLNTLYLKNTLCTDPELYERLKHDFVLWYCDCDKQIDEITDYATQYVLPLVCIIDPTDMSNAVGMLSGWTDHDRFVEFLDEYGLWNPVDDVVLPEGYNAYNDGRYIWLWEHCDGGAALVGYYSLVTNDTGYVCDQYSRGVFPEPTGHVDVPEYVYLSGAGVACDDGASAIPVVALDNGIFCNCTNMTSVTLPDTLRWIGYSVFDNTGITSLLLPDGLREIVGCAFANSSLEEINVPGSLEFVDYGVFSGTPWLEAQGDFAVYGDFLVAYQGDNVDVEIPDSVRVICEDAFNLSAVENVHIPDSVKIIDEYAFYEAANLIEITGGNNVEYVGWDAFGGTGVWEKTPEGELVRAGNMIIGYKEVLPESLEIPEGVTVIGAGALSFCTNITSLTLPTTLRHINDWAFEDCSNLKDVVFKGGRDNVTMDISSAFYRTPWLENKTFDPPENDNIADALLLVGTTGRIEATNLGATSEEGEDDLGHWRSTVWWKWKAADNVRMTFDTFGSDIDSVLGVYVYEDGSLVEVAYNDDCDETDGYQSRVSFDAEGDVTYYIAVSGYDSEMGDIVLNWNVFSDAIPELDESATTEQVAAVLEGSADAKLAANIKTAAEYMAYRTWALGLEGVTPEQVKASPNAWLSYALDTDALIATAPKDGDVVIDTFESSSTDGAFVFTVKIDDIKVGDNALEANIKKVFDIEGAEKLASDGVGESGVGFSSENVEVNVVAPENGNVKFTVTPKLGNGEWGTGNGENPASFFFRVKMK